MTYEELEDRVRELESALTKVSKALSTVQDELVKQRRLYEDSINNLDEDNFAASYRVQQGNKFSEMKQSAESIVMVVGTVYGVPEQLFGEKPDNNSDKTVLYSYYEKDENGEYFPEAGEKYTFKCYYRYNSISKKWEEVDTKSVMSQFVQTVDGFKLSGHVVIDGNTFVNGTFQTASDDGNYAVRVATDNKTAMIQIRNTVDDMPLFYIQKAGLADTDIGSTRVNIFASAYYNAYLDFTGKVNFGNADVYGLYAVFE